MPTKTIHPLLSETLISLADAAKRIPPFRSSRPTSTSTIFRWITSGVTLPNGDVLKLEAMRIVSRWVTTTEALDRFLNATNDAAQS